MLKGSVVIIPDYRLVIKLQSGECRIQSNLNQGRRKCKRDLFLKIDRWMLNSKVALCDALHM